jgi:hypothetical protein
LSKWAIEGELTKPDGGKEKFQGVVSHLDGVSEIVQEKDKAKTQAAEVAGNKRDGAGVKGLEMTGKIKARITSAEDGSPKGDLDGKFRGLVQAGLSGIYVVPPPECSEADMPLSDTQMQELKTRRDPRQGKPREGDLTGKPGRVRSNEETTERTARTLKAQQEMKEKGQQLADQSDANTLVAEVRNTKAARPAEPHTRGRFMRKVQGTVTAIEPLTIELDLPNLPILDHKCTVIGEAPKRVLKLVKQHDQLKRGQ